jgi:hypothetical protein
VGSFSGLGADIKNHPGENEDDGNHYQQFHQGQAEGTAFSARHATPLSRRIRKIALGSINNYNTQIGFAGRNIAENIHRRVEKNAERLLRPKLQKPTDNNL